jgi:hypothetical protein
LLETSSVSNGISARFVLIFLVIIMVGFAGVPGLYNFASATAVSARITGPPTVDGTRKAWCVNCSSVSITITTTHADDLIYVLTFDSWIGPDTESISSNPSLHWQNRISFSTPNDMDTWFAIWPGQGKITVTLSTPQVIVNEVIMGFGISSVDASQPFDTNPSLVASSTCYSSCGTIESVSLSTDNWNDLVIAATNAAAGGIMTPGSCCVLINGMTAGGLAYQTESFPQSNLVLTYTSQYAPNRWILIGDAVRGQSFFSR